MNDPIAGLVREAFMLLVSTGGPLVGLLLAVGLMVGILQATTQVNDPAMGFLPRLLAALLGSWALGGWVLERLSRFLASAIGRMANHL